MNPCPNGTTVKPIPSRFWTICTAPQLLDELFNIPVVDDISFGCLDKSLLGPDVVHHMIPLHPQGQCLLRQPEVRQDAVLILVIQRREYKYEGGNVRGIYP